MHMKKLLKIISWPFDWVTNNLEGIVICGVIVFFATIIELHVFHIPNEYADVIWLSNTIITILVFIYAVNMTKKDYEEKIDNFMRGIPTEEEFRLYESEIKEIEKKYSGEERFNKIREFIIKRRTELMLNKIYKKQ
jgi:hypothetical protein